MRILLSLLSSLIIGTSVFANQVQSRIEKVELYQGTVRVTRSISIKADSSSDLVQLSGLPGRIQTQNIIVESNSEGDFARNISFQVLGKHELPESDTVRLKRNELSDLQEDLKDIEHRENLLKWKLKYKKDQFSALMDAAEEGKAPASDNVDLIVSELLKIEDDLYRLVTSNRERIRKLKKSIDQTKMELRKVEARWQGLNGQLEFEIIDGDLNGSVELNFTYTLTGANWQPAYELSANVEDENIEIRYNALVNNYTGEDWNGIDLILFTGQVNGATQAPELWPLYLDEPSQVGLRVSEGRAKNRDQVFELSPFSVEAKTEDGFRSVSMPPPPEMESVQRGFQVSLGTAGKVTIESGVGERQILILEKSVASSFWSETTPVRDLKAYLHASFINELDTPLIPGRASLRVDGAYTGAGWVEATQSGEELEIGFGENPLVQVELKDIVIPKKEKGIFGKTRRLQKHYRVTVKNLMENRHDFVLNGQFPVSRHEDAKVTQLLPKHVDVDSEDGSFSIELNLEAGGTGVQDIHYKIEMPLDWPVPYGI